MKRAVVIILLLFTMSATAGSQRSTQTIAERLGYPRNAKLLIVHADDLGMTHSVNAATIKAFQTGLVNSGSVMTTCPWLLEIAAYARANPQADLGIHVTLTSEWTNFRWGPVSPKDRVNSLLDSGGYFYRTASDAATHADPKQVENEIAAQIERARAVGIQPTHLDSHMGTLFQNRAMFAALMHVSHSQKLPVRVTRGDFPPEVLSDDDVYVDRVLEIDPSIVPQDWAKFYSDALRKLQPGVTEVILHPAYDDAEMRAVTQNNPDWGAAWRQRDLDYFTSNDFRGLLAEAQIKLITWRDIRKAIE